MLDFYGVAVEIDGTKFICAGRQQDGDDGRLVELESVSAVLSWDAAAVEVTHLLGPEAVKDITVAVLCALEEEAVCGR